MNYIFYAILIYLFYRFITGFVLPVVRATSQVKRQFNNMQQQAGAQQEQRQPGNRHSNGNGFDQRPKYDVEGEYIKFEEIKD